MSKIFGKDNPLPVMDIELPESDIKTVITHYAGELPEPDRVVFLEKMQDDVFRLACQRAVREMAILISASEIVENEFNYLKVRSSLNMGSGEVDQDPILLKMRQHLLESCIDNASMRLLTTDRFEEERMHRRLEVELGRISGRQAAGREHAAAR